MYSGIHTLNLDAKGRLAIPAKHRERLVQECAGHVVVTVNPDKKDLCLVLYPENEWRETAHKLSQLSSMNRRSRAMQRLMVGHATALDLDAQGRILLPNELRDFAGLSKKAVFLGQMNRFEIWDHETWHGSQDLWLNEAGGPEDSEELQGFTL